MKKLSILLMVPVVAALATGTIIEKYHGNEFATEHVYASWWFILLLALVAAGCIAAILREKMWHTPHRMLIYSSAVVILLGGGLTTWTGSHGEMTLLPGQPNDTYLESDSTARRLPFSVTLDNFEVVTYPGSHSPMDFVSHIAVDGETADISMNNIYRRQGYRLYQADYTPDGSSVLSVSYDPIGIAVTYCGYLILIAGLIVMFLSPRSHFRRLLKALPLLLLLVGGTASAAPSTLPRQTADRMGRIMVLYKGRICPLQTVAKDYTTKLCGKATYQGLTPEQVLSGWIFYHSEWADEPMIKIKGAELRRQLGLDGRYATYNQLAPQLSGGNNAMPGSTEGIPDKKRRAAEEKVNLVQMVANSQLLKIYPVADSTGTIGWYSQNDPLPLSVDSDEYIFIRKQLGYCQELVVKGDYETLGQVFDKTCEYQQKKAAAILPAPSRIAAERLYNRLTTGRWLYMLVISLGLLSFAIALYSPKGGKGKWSLLNSRLAFGLVALLTAFLLLIFILRWIAGGHAPMAGGFDSMTLMSLVIGIVALCTARRHPHGASHRAAHHGLLSACGHDERLQPACDQPHARAQLTVAHAACHRHHDSLCALLLCHGRRRGGSHPAGSAADYGAHQPADALSRCGIARLGHSHRSGMGQHLVGQLLVLGPQGGVGAHHPARLPLPPLHEPARRPFLNPVPCVVCGGISERCCHLFRRQLAVGWHPCLQLIALHL